MKPLTHEWTQKAEADWLTAQRESVARPPNHDAVCFHAQQCAEKYLKALLQERETAFPKTHDLEELVDLLLPDMPQLQGWRAAGKALTQSAIQVRYPGEWAGAEEARDALEQCRTIRAEMRRRLAMPEEQGATQAPALE